MVLEVLMVPKAGLEPARISTVDFESTASTDFATSALKGCGNVLDYTCRRRSCKRQRVVIALSVEKNSAILRGVSFTAVPGRDCHQQPSSHNPTTPAPPASHSLSLAPKLHSKSSLFFSHHSHPNHSTHPSPISTPNYSPPHPPAFPYIPESFNQCLLLLTHSAVKY